MSAEQGARAVVAALGAAAPPGTGRPAVVLIDGGSGAGKSTLAFALERLCPSAQVIRLDDIYPGWDGLEAASLHLREQVLAPLSVGAPARWQRFDWTADAPAEWIDVDRHRPLVVEGSGALSRANRALSTIGVWIELDAETRKFRALLRDGDRFAPWWDRWADQETIFAARERPRQLADLELDGRGILDESTRLSPGVDSMGA